MMIGNSRYLFFYNRHCFLIFLLSYNIIIHRPTPTIYVNAMILKNLRFHVIILIKARMSLLGGHVFLWRVRIREVTARFKKKVQTCTTWEAGRCKRHVWLCKSKSKVDMKFHVADSTPWTGGTCPACTARISASWPAATHTGPADTTSLTPEQPCNDMKWYQ